MATVWLSIPDRWCKPATSGLLIAAGNKAVLVGPTEVLGFPLRKRGKEWVAMFMPGLNGRGSVGRAIDDSELFAPGTGPARGLTAVVFNDSDSNLETRALCLEAAAPRGIFATDLAVPTDQGDDGNTSATLENALCDTYIGAPVVVENDDGIVELLGLTVGPARAVPIAAVLELARAAAALTAPTALPQ